MKEHLPSRPIIDQPNRLGLDTDPAKKDAGFYQWIEGEDPEAALAEVVKWLIDDLREETDEVPVRELLDDWRSRCTSEDFHQRLIILGKIFPPNHPFHHVKNLYVSDV